MVLGYGFLPVVWSLYTFLVFLLCYLLAVHFNHVYPFVPAISDTGAYPPEGNIFAELFSISAYLGILNICVRYLQLRLSIGEDLLLTRLNKVTVIFGVLSAVGATIIANFESKTVSFTNSFCRVWYTWVEGTEGRSATNNLAESCTLRWSSFKPRYFIFEIVFFFSLLKITASAFHFFSINIYFIRLYGGNGIQNLVNSYFKSASVRTCFDALEYLLTYSVNTAFIILLHWSYNVFKNVPLPLFFPTVT